MPHKIEKNHHRRRSAIGALDFSRNTMLHTVHRQRRRCAYFIDGLLAAHENCPTVIVLDNARIHHGIDEATRQRGLLNHKVLLFYLPAYSPELTGSRLSGGT